LNRAIAEQVLAECILPPAGKTDEEVAWTDRLLNTMEFLDEKAVGILFSLSGVKTQYVQAFVIMSSYS
jgi:sister chromatid cohesion protein PDS5